MVAVGCLGSAGLIVLSFSQQGEILSKINSILTENLGSLATGSVIALGLLGLLFLRLKINLAKFNVFIGYLMVWGGLIILGRAGKIGEQIGASGEEMVSGAGVGLGSLIIIFLGLVILTDTSLGKVLNFLIKLFSDIAAIFKKAFSGSGKMSKIKPLVGQQNLPMKIPEKSINESRSAKSSVTPPLAISSPLELGTALVSSSGANKIWEYPPLSLLSEGPGQKADRGDMNANADMIEKTLDSFGITARVAETNKGPAVTQYALAIAQGTKISKITALSNDLALALAAPTGQIRIEAPIPGRSLVGIEIPNRSLEFVTLKQMLSSGTMQNAKNKTSVTLGLDVAGNPLITTISKMPHVLIAGTTGSGKSVLINSWIASILYRASPDEVKLILVDPKRVELIGYNGIPHLLVPVIVEVDKILSALKWAIGEMERRYKLFANNNVRNIDSFNELAALQTLPYIVIFIDELADLMSYAPVEVEDSICRLAQMARATGIHLVVATQRPSVDVITGLIKANIPCRIAFNVSSMVDSRVIIDGPGAEKLLGRGDMLYIPPDQAKPSRVQGTFVSENEIVKLVDFLKSKNPAVQYTEEVTSQPVTLRSGNNNGQVGNKDNFFTEAVKIVCQYDKASASLLQRRLSVGYARAARIIDQMEAAGIVGPGEGSKPRDVLVRNADEYFASLAEGGAVVETV